MQLAHTIHGEGPTLVLIHGVVHRRHAWNPVLDLLTPHRRVVTVDLAGHGDSPAMPTGADSLRAGRAYVEEFLDQIAPGERVHVAGNSLGGWVALELAARGAVASATALSPVGFFVNKADQARTVNTFRVLRRGARTMGPRMDRILETRSGRTIGLSAFMAKPWLVDPEAAKIDTRSLVSNEILDELIVNRKNVDFTFSPIADPNIPITVAWGKLDMILPAYQAKRVQRTFPNAKTTTYSGIGHVPMSDNPRLIAQILLEGSAARASIS